MAIQDIDKAVVSVSRRAGVSEDKDAQAQIDQLFEQQQRLAKELIGMHNVMANFAISIGNALTTIAVTLPFTFPDTAYCVSVNLNFNSGGWWVTGKTTTGFTLNWVTATVGTQAARFLIVD